MALSEHELLLQHIFPALADTEYEITSPRDEDYNCIAWAANDNSNWWEPDQAYQYFWPEGVPRNYSIESYIEAYNTIGYEECDNGEIEEDFIKIAIFVNPHTNQPTHVARQLPNGGWTSKLGRDVDIRHQDVNGVCNQNYGEVAVFMKRGL